MEAKDKGVGIEPIGKAAFDAVYEENVDIVYKTALRYTQNHHAAEEITQNAFLKFYTVMDHSRLKAARPWLILTAKNMSLNWKRDGKWEYPVGEFTEEQQEEISVHVESPENIFMRKVLEQESAELTGDIFALLYEKNRRWYEAVTLAYVMEKPQKEVAELLGMDLEALHSMLYRAKQWIRTYYEARYNELDKA